MNDLHIGHGGVPFDKPGFWREANSILFEGTREMLINIKDKNELVAAYDRMDWSLGEMVERWQPPEEAKAELHAKLNDRLSFIGRKMKNDNIDPATYWVREEKRVSIILLSAAGVRSHEMRLDRLTEAAAAVLSGGSNLTQEGAERLIREFASYDCRNLGDMMGNVREDPNHMELLSFLKRNGTPRAQAEAQRAMNRMLPEEPKRLAVVIEMRRPVPEQSVLRR